MSRLHQPWSPGPGSERCLPKDATTPPLACADSYPNHSGADLTAAAQTSSWWPALVTNLTHGLERGWTISDLIGTPPNPGHLDGLEIGQALVWRTGPDPGSWTCRILHP